MKECLLVAALALALAGWPFWLTNVPFSLAFAYDRFTLPFIFGASLLLISLILLLPWRPLRWLVLAALVGVGCRFPVPDQPGLPPGLGGPAAVILAAYAGACPTWRPVR